MDVIMNSSIGLLMLWPPAMMDGSLELWARISSEIESDEPLQALARTSPTRQTIPSNWEPKESLSPLSHFQWVLCHTNKKSHLPSAHTHSSSFILCTKHYTFPAGRPLTSLHPDNHMIVQELLWPRMLVPTDIFFTLLTQHWDVSYEKLAFLK